MQITAAWLTRGSLKAIWCVSRGVRMVMSKLIDCVTQCPMRCAPIVSHQRPCIPKTVAQIARSKSPLIAMYNSNTGAQGHCRDRGQGGCGSIYFKATYTMYVPHEADFHANKAVELPPKPNQQSSHPANRNTSNQRIMD
jgi:hypothetical protein